MVKKILLFFIIFAVLGFIGYQFLIKNKIQISNLPIKIAYNYWPSVFWIEIAGEKGWFEEAGLNVELVDYNKNWYQSNSDLIEGKIDAAGLYMFDVVIAEEKGADLAVVLNAGVSFGSDILVARNGIKTINDLKGKKIGVMAGSSYEYELSVALEKGNLKLSDIEKVEINGEKAVEAISNNIVDAIMSWDPYASDAINQLSATRLFDTSEVPGLMPDVFVLKKSFIDNRLNDVQALTEVWYRTTEFIKNKPDEAFGVIAKKYGYTLEEVKDFSQIDKIYDLDNNLKSFAYSSDRLSSLHGNIKDINNYLINQGIFPGKVDSTRILDPRFIRKLNK